MCREEIQQDFSYISGGLTNYTQVSSGHEVFVQVEVIKLGEIIVEYLVCA